MPDVEGEKHEQLKRAILKGVFEENVGLRKAPARRPSRLGAGSRAPVPRPRFRGHLTAVLLGLLLLVGDGAALRIPGVPATQAVAISEPSLDPGKPPPTAAAAVGAPVKDVPLPAGPELAQILANAPFETPERYSALLEQDHVSIAGLFGLEFKTIVIDPGHGGRDPGAIGPLGTKEKDAALEIGMRLRERLSQYPGFRVLMTRDTDVKLTLKERVEFAKRNQADLFVSIHFNSLPVEDVNLVETYYFGPHEDERTLELAQAENRDSEFAVGDFKDMIAKIGDTMKTQESRLLAASIQKSLYGNLKTQNPDVINAGIKTAPFVVLLGVDVPSVLAEISCISNNLEERNLSRPAYRDEIARYIEQGISSYLEQHPQQRKLAQGDIKYVAEKE